MGYVHSTTSSKARGYAPAANPPITIQEITIPAVWLGYRMKYAAVATPIIPTPINPLQIKELRCDPIRYAKSPIGTAVMVAQPNIKAAVKPES